MFSGISLGFSNRIYLNHAFSAFLICRKFGRHFLLYLFIYLFVSIKFKSGRKNGMLRCEKLLWVRNSVSGLWKRDLVVIVGFFP